FLASALTFDALLAAIPFILLVLVGLTHLAQAVSGGPAVDPSHLFHRFFPSNPTEGRDPFTFIEKLLAGITNHRGQISLYAVPAFIWFSTRLFAGVRTSLNDIYDVSARPLPRRHFIVNWLAAKLRDMGMVVATVLLFLANTLLTTGLTIVASRGREAPPHVAFCVSPIGHVLVGL